MNLKLSKVSTLLKAFMITLMLLLTFSISAPSKAAETAPAKVLGLTQTSANANSIKFQWTASLGSSIRYYVETSTDGINWVADTSYTTSANQSRSNLTPGTSFFVRVRAGKEFWNSNINKYETTYGEYSDPLLVITSPSKVETVTQIDGSFDSITLQWTPVVGASYYQICNHVGYNQDVLITTTTGTTAVLGSLPLNSKYSFSIIPVIQSPTFTAIGDATTASTNCVTAADSVADFALGNLWANLGSGNLQWTRNPNATSYEVLLYTVKGNKQIGTYSSTDSSCSFKNIKKNTFYKAKIRPVTTINNQPKYGNWSQFIYFSSQPSKMESKTTKNSIRASWSKVNGATSYTVYVSTRQKTAYKKVATVKGTRYTIKKYGKQNLKSNKEYYFSVKANIKVGNETYSSEMPYCLNVKTK